jgi:hypothetical protein
MAVWQAESRYIVLPAPLKTALKEMMLRNIIQASFKPNLKKSQSRLLNDTFSRFTLFVSHQKI